jgi:hypothetical protein
VAVSLNLTTASNRTTSLADAGLIGQHRGALQLSVDRLDQLARLKDEFSPHRAPG